MSKVPAGLSAAPVAARAAIVLSTLLAAWGGVGGRGPSTAPLTSGVMATIPVGTPPTLLAMSPNGARVFALSSGSLSIIDAASNAVVGTVKTPPYPTGLAVTPDGGRVLVDNVQTTRLVVVDAATATLQRSINLIVDIHPGGFGRIAVTPDGSRAYIANQPKEYLAVVEMVAVTSTESMLDMRPSDLALSSDGRTLYVAGCKEFCTTGTVQLIDTASRNLLREFNVGGSPYRFALSPDGRRAYTTNLAGPSLSVVDVVTGATLATLPVGVEPTGLAVSPDGTHVYVVSQAERRMTIVDATQNVVAGDIGLPSEPREVVVAPDGRRLWVSTRDAVLVLDAARLR